MILALVTPFEILKWLCLILMLLKEVDELDDAMSLDVFLPWLRLLIRHEFPVILQISHLKLINSEQPLSSL